MTLAKDTRPNICVHSKELCLPPHPSKQITPSIGWAYPPLSAPAVFPPPSPLAVASVTMPTEKGWVQSERGREKLTHGYKMFFTDPLIESGCLHREEGGAGCSLERKGKGSKIID